MSSLGDKLVALLQTPHSVRSLARDTSMRNFPRRVEGSAFAAVPVQPLNKPIKIIAASVPALRLLLDASSVRLEDENELQLNDGDACASSNFTDVFSGSKAAGSAFWSHNYWGTQFGNYAGQLGDGAATLIGESNGFEVNLKGSGPTPFSRGFDGRKVVRSSVREFLASEAMHGLRIPTTRAGSLIASETQTVMRDISYSGRPVMEKCAVVSRIAKTFFRFGSFENESTGVVDTAAVKELVRYVKETVMDKKCVLEASDCGISNQSPPSFMQYATIVTARLIAAWQCVGFVHGVMNTDNMSIIGDTIDYGPFGFMETFDPYFVPNTSDKFGRYMYLKQPDVGLWNLLRLRSLVAMHAPDYVSESTEADVASLYWSTFNQRYSQTMRKKLGLIGPCGDEIYNKIHGDLFGLLKETGVDYTVTFRALCKLNILPIHDVTDIIMATYPSPERVNYLCSVGQRIGKADLPEIEQFAATRMDELERVGIDKYSIEKWKFNIERMDEFNDIDWNILKITAFEKWKKFLTELAPLIDSDYCRAAMSSVNPIYIPRQHLMQNAIDKYEQENDPSELVKLLQLFANPFHEQLGTEYDMYAKPDLGYFGACLSCSS